jgi:hydrogenase expression/formation protein HypC
MYVMCLAVPGRIVSIESGRDDPFSGPLATVDFQGSRVEVSLQLTPTAVQGDWVLVHAGFALQILDAEEAREMWEYLEMAEMVGEMPPELKSLKSETEGDKKESPFD